MFVNGARQVFTGASSQAETAGSGLLYPPASACRPESLSEPTLAAVVPWEFVLESGVGPGRTRRADPQRTTSCGWFANWPKVASLVRLTLWIISAYGTGLGNFMVRVRRMRMGTESNSWNPPRVAAAICAGSAFMTLAEDYFQHGCAASPEIGGGRCRAQLLLAWRRTGS